MNMRTWQEAGEIEAEMTRRIRDNVNKVRVNHLRLPARDYGDTPTGEFMKP